MKGKCDHCRMDIEETLDGHAWLHVEYRHNYRTGKTIKIQWIYCRARERPMQWGPDLTRAEPAA